MLKKRLSLRDLLDIEKGIMQQSNIQDKGEYMLELIRIADSYKFQLEIKKKVDFEEEEIGAFLESQENGARAGKWDETNSISNVVRHFAEQEFPDIEYRDETVKIQSNTMSYAPQTKGRVQELWEKTGFYQEKTTQAKVRVQLWPEHLPYDHFKRKKAFLFL